MMELTVELLRKHKDRLIEATTTVKGYSKHSKKGTAFNVKTHERKIPGGFKVGQRVLGGGKGPGTVVGPGKNPNQVKIKFDHGPTLSVDLKRGIHDLKAANRSTAKALKQADKEHPIIRKEVRPDGTIYIQRKK